MIAKRIKRDKATSDFGKLGRYILEARTEQAAILWTRTAEYILDAQGTGEKVAWSRITNCQTEIPALAIEEIQLAQANNTRSKGDKTYHMVVSFPEGERPTREQLEDIEDRICEGLGFAGHQRMSAVHKDTDNLHLHIAINKVHPETFRCVEPYYDHFKLDKLCRELEVKHGLIQDNRIEQGQRKGKAAEMDAHAAEASLLSWIQEHALEAILKSCEGASNWQTLHDTLADFGLEIRPRGAGLVVGLMGDKLSVKASRLDRRLSFKALTDRWGAYPAPLITPKEPTQRYEKAQYSQSESTVLYAEYQQFREESLANREQKLQVLRKEHAQYAQKLKSLHAERYQAIKKNPLMSPSQKKTAYRQLAEERQADFEECRALEAEQRKAIRMANMLPSWPDFLQAKAEMGNTAALSALRYRRKRQERLKANILTADSLEEAKQLIFQDLEPSVRKNGDVIYRLKDGGMLVDEAHHVRVAELTPASAFLALTLAQERFLGRPLVVNGSEEFKCQVREMAKQGEFKLSFATKVVGQGPQVSQQKI